MDNRRHRRRKGKAEPTKPAAGDESAPVLEETTGEGTEPESKLPPVAEPAAGPDSAPELPEAAEDAYGSFPEAPELVEADEIGGPNEPSPAAEGEEKAESPPDPAPPDAGAEYYEEEDEEEQPLAAASEADAPPDDAGPHRQHGATTEDTSSNFYRRYVRPILGWRLPLPLSLLDRYILESLLTPLFIIFCGFTGIWIIYDLSDNLQEFLNAKVGLLDIALFYAACFPQIALISLQVSLLLAVLYSLSRLSRTHELVAMLSAGRSVPRMLLPLFVVGLVASLICIGLSYKLAPWAEAEKEAQLQSLIRGEKREPVLYGTLYRNRYDNRTWHVRRMSMDGQEMSRVHILQQDADRDVIYTLIFKDARYDPATREWFLDSVVMHFFDKEGNWTSKEYRRYMTVRGWRETPELIVGANQNPEHMGVPDLRQYLLDNADFPEQQLAPFRTFLYYRWSLPWMCMVVVLFGAPLGMAFSRGGIMSNIATAIFLFIGLIFGQEVFNALGKGARLDPWVAAWLPNIALALIGLYLLGLRSANRSLPKLNLYGLYTAITSVTERKKASTRPGASPGA